MTFVGVRAGLLELQTPDRLWNAIISRCGASFPLAAKGSSAVIQPTSEPQACEVVALVAFGSTRVVVAFENYPFKLLFDANIDAASLGVLSKELRDILFEGMLSSVWSLLPQNEYSNYQTVAIGECHEIISDIDRQLDWFSASIMGLGPEAVRIRLGCVTSEAALAVGLGQIAAARTWLALSTTLTLEAYFSLPALKTTVTEVRAFAAGDIVVMMAGAQYRLIVCFGRNRHEFRAVGGSWTYVGVEERGRTPLKTEIEEGTMSDDALGNEASESRPITLGELPIDIDFDIGERQIPLSTLESWRPGSVVKLDPPELTGEVVVTLRANGRKIARGDLVTIDDRLAVRLTHILIDA